LNIANQSFSGSIRSNRDRPREISQIPRFILESEPQDIYIGGKFGVLTTSQVSFKNTRETAQAINGYTLVRAIKFLENVQAHKEAVPMRRYAGGTGRASQGTNTSTFLMMGDLV